MNPDDIRFEIHDDMPDGTMLIVRDDVDWTGLTSPWLIDLTKRVGPRIGVVIENIGTGEDQP